MEHSCNFHRLYRRALPLARLTGFVAILLAAATASALDFRDVLPGFAPYDFNQDGVAEIESLELMFDDELAESTPSNAELVVVLVEERLLDYVPGSPYSTTSLINRLDRFRTDLRLQGYSPKVVVARVYAGDEHQDGRTVLALRELLRATRDSYPNLAGTILVGDFPEAMVVRSLLRKKYRDGEPLLNVWPQVIARRTDLVLADLNGAWEEIYIADRTDLEVVEARDVTASPDNPKDWPCNGCELLSRDYASWYGESYEDFFFVRDGSFFALASGDPDVTKVRMIETHRGPELAEDDRSLSNPIARPEIAVSRINARHVAIAPDPTWRDLDGKGLLDSLGRPQTVRSNSVPKWWHDPGLERRLLVEYLDRNHAYRAGIGAPPLRTSAISFPKEDFPVSTLSSYLQKAATGSFLSPLKVENGSVLDFVGFLKQPAALKGIHAHADRVITAFDDDYDVADLEQAIGPYIWNWKKQGAYWVPTLGSYGDRVGDELFYTMWRNNRLSSTGGVFYAHMGCDVNSPSEAETSPYNDSTYGRYQNAESHLFFANGVAMVSRSKDFNDKPAGFTEALDDSADTPFGKGWSRQFEDDAKSSSLTDIGRKRSYSWGLLGDWTLALAPTDADDHVVVFDGYSYTQASARLGLGMHDRLDHPLRLDLVDSIAVPSTREVRIIDRVGGVGRYVTLREDVQDVDRFEFDNKIYSAEVRERETIKATLYSEAGYWGNSAVLPPGHYTYDQLYDGFGLNPRSVSSMRLQGVEVFLYDGQTWTSTFKPFGQSVYNLSSYGWNDRMRSIVVVPKGRYGTVYQHASWSGQHAALEPGRYDYNDLKAMGLPNLGISSVSMPSGIRMKLYRQTGFQGVALVLDGQSVRNLADRGWNDVVKSIIVELR